MDKLNSAIQAHSRLEATLEDPPNEKTRDAAIQRFEFRALSSLKRQVSILREEEELLDRLETLDLRASSVSSMTGGEGDYFE